MNLQEDFSNIENSEEFKEFKKNNPDSILTSIFLNKENWEFNYFSKDKMITFLKENNVIKTEESEIYEKQEIEKLELEKVKITFNQAEELAKKLMSDEKITKEIVVLQQKENPYWNITYITSGLNVFNLKLNAINGNIIEQKFENIMNFNTAVDQ
jgi:hypothetical protein